VKQNKEIFVKLKLFKHLNLVLIIIILLLFHCYDYNTKNVKPKKKYVLAVVNFFQDKKLKIHPAPKIIDSNIIKLFISRNIKAYIYPFANYRKILSGEEISQTMINFVLPKISNKADYLCFVKINLEEVQEKYNKHIAVIYCQLFFHNMKTNKLYQTIKFKKSVYENREKKAINRAFYVINEKILEEIKKYIDKEFIDK
jgi:hypothetical protein